MKRETGWERWKDAPGQDGADPWDPDVRIGELLRRAGRPPEPSPARLARIEARLAARPARPAWPFALRWAVAAALVAGAGGAAAATGLPQRLARAVAAWVAPAQPEPSHRVASRAAPGRSERAADLPSELAATPTRGESPPEEPVASGGGETPVVAPPGPAAVVAGHAPGAASPAQVTPRARAETRPAREPRPSAGRSPPVEPRSGAAAPAASALADEEAAGALVEEAALLQRAMTRLHRHGDAAGALALLDEHQRRFPLGTLAGEAALARVDALLALGRIDEAAALGRSSPDLPLPRRRELQVLEAESLATRDCARALERFEAVQLGLLPGDLRERVLYGRALCKARLGRKAAARADLWRYLDEYPEGRFAAQVRRALAGEGDGETR